LVDLGHLKWLQAKDRGTSYLDPEDVAKVAKVDALLQANANLDTARASIGIEAVSEFEQFEAHKSIEWLFLSICPPITTLPIPLRKKPLRKCYLEDRFNSN
jgi:hypothetical protein